MEFTFLGTGTSQGVPVIACQCAVCTSSDPRDQRLRTSGLLRSDTTTLVIDTGPDFRQQMLRQRVMDLDAVVYTHPHKDHTGGLDDVRAYNYLKDTDMPLYGTRAVLTHLEKEYYYIFQNPSYPGLPRIAFHEITGEEDLLIGDISLRPIPAMHGRMPVLGYRCGDFAYLTDVNYLSPTSMDLLAGVRYLAIDALRHQPHHSHYHVEAALEVVATLQPQAAYFIHISHLLGRHADVQASLPPGVYLAYDGLQLSW
ncbi:MAG: MBL fold metallo-hydrolase [Bacteroidia bacterium]